jgi:hypothetical protein
MDTSRDRRRDFIEFRHPGLRDVTWSIESCRTNAYNCIAFALGFTNQRWQPDPRFGDHWPRDIPQEDTEEAWIALFEKFGFIRCADGNFEAEAEKIAIYADSDGATHVAKLVSPGVWHSKMGNEEDVYHPLAALKYGCPKYFFRRPRKPKQPPSRTAQKRAKRL